MGSKSTCRKQSHSPIRELPTSVMTKSSRLTERIPRRSMSINPQAERSQQCSKARSLGLTRQRASVLRSTWTARLLPTRMVHKTGLKSASPGQAAIPILKTNRIAAQVLPRQHYRLEWWAEAAGVEHQQI